MTDEQEQAAADYDRHRAEAVDLLAEAAFMRPIGEEDATDRYRGLVAEARAHAALAQAAALRSAP